MSTLANPASYDFVIIGAATIVVDRRARELLGAFIAGPGASEAIGEAVLAVKTRTPIDVLADTIHPFPTTLRVMGNLFIQAARRPGVATSWSHASKEQ